MSSSLNRSLETTTQPNSYIDKTWTTCYLGLGSNLANELGSPVEHLQQAFASLRQHEKVRDLRASSFYASAPMGPQDQPDFINAVIGFETTLSAFELLALCQHLENNAQRARLRHWGERSLDVDILLYGQTQIIEPQLTIPHAGLTERNFVLIPLRELAPKIMIAQLPISSYPQSNDWTGLKLIDASY
ncbi:2-amino-4-hydroxy-6-hydroxymethyldihydropteridine diphosphokinase [Psychrobacter frigidicola]|uniref:2-amino-4-hydroxy-6-hydroxymethyldihydropteridine pyrophosphokinase n=1 Tax=Psychrobacter frigidicola TaxID=45611 RepID=A0A5C7A0G1_9GAMM|nr:2-amino-4-hydroxy-6-hydroxymethyldihydropteridine diphosphokinase [Psychrobacter frigidicola]TXD96884.1 2-amino-4-hydroxy-6-hydroxymethyldihydropteridine diphosphokinase [Psychrobacter frigidicola]